MFDNALLTSEPMVSKLSSISDSWRLILWNVSASLLVAALIKPTVELMKPITSLIADALTATKISLKRQEDVKLYLI